MLRPLLSIVDDEPMSLTFAFKGEVFQLDTHNILFKNSI